MYFQIKKPSLPKNLPTPDVFGVKCLMKYEGKINF